MHSTYIVTDPDTASQWSAEVYHSGLALTEGTMAGDGENTIVIRMPHAVWNAISDHVSNEMVRRSLARETSDDVL